jgi:hypothetical protein
MAQQGIAVVAQVLDPEPLCRRCGLLRAHVKRHGLGDNDKVGSNR